MTHRLLKPDEFETSSGTDTWEPGADLLALFDFDPRLCCIEANGDTLRISQLGRTAFHIHGTKFWRLVVK
jgi:hypothetical protein